MNIVIDIVMMLAIITVALVIRAEGRRNTRRWEAQQRARELRRYNEEDVRRTQALTNVEQWKADVIERERASYTPLGFHRHADGSLYPGGEHS